MWVIAMMLVIVGTGLLAAGLYYTQRIISQLAISPQSWWAMFYLILFFVVGYLIFAAHLVNREAPSITFVVATIFMGGGLFVFLVTRLSAKTIYDVRHVAELESENIQIRAKHQRLEDVFDAAAEGIFVFNSSGMVESINRAAEHLFGYPEREVIGKDITLLISPPERTKGDDQLGYFLRTEIKRLLGREGEVVGRHKDGGCFPVAIKISTLHHLGSQLYTALVSDIRERKAAFERLQYLAEHDALTGLYNRGYLQAELERIIGRAQSRDGQSCALLYLDLDNFKYVNDTLGHIAGDRLLREIADILRSRCRKTDLTARFGGDEFAILLYNVDAEMAVKVAESYREQVLQHRFFRGTDRIEIGCSIGVSVISSEAESLESILAHADFAGQLAKREGRNRVRLFRANDAVSLETMSSDMGWSHRIRDAIQHGRFALACQPIVDVQTGDIDSYEVLIRMIDYDNELIMPTGFLPSAERFGLIVDIDKWVIVNAIDALVKQRKSIPALRYCLNLSAKTFGEPHVVDLILDRLRATGLAPDALTFEITETYAIADMAVAKAFLKRLQDIGCKTALDDFGSGFSSFAYLQELPIDYVKIDGRFVRNLAESAIDQAMVRAMNDIIHVMGKKTIVEFVENEQSLALLKQYGVDFAQGYHVGSPAVVTPSKSIGAGTHCKLEVHPLA